MEGFTLYSDSVCTNPVQLTFLQQDGYTAADPTFCVPYSLNGPFVKGRCLIGSFSFTNYSDGYCLTSLSSKQTVSGGCSSHQGVYATVTVPCSCFHESTVVSYEGSLWTLPQLVEEKEARCHVPHVVHEEGVRVWTSCERVLRVTNTHLVFTIERGMVEAGKLKQGETLEGGWRGEKRCIVERVEREEKMERYFGLNCEVSVVIADGYKTSTFGGFHTLPSLWMKFVSKLVGVKMASKIGDKIVHFIFSVNFPLFRHLFSL